jgi:hypothetical protein
MKIVRKRKHRSRTISEHSDEGLLLRTGISTVDSWRGVEELMCLLEFGIQLCCEILVVAGRLYFFRETFFLIFSSLKQANEKSF